MFAVTVRSWNVILVVATIAIATAVISYTIINMDTSPIEQLESSFYSTRKTALPVLTTIPVNYEVRPASEVRDASHEISGPYLGSGSIPAHFSNVSLPEAQLLFHSLITNPSYNCERLERFGRIRDGGYYICTDGRLKVAKGQCLVYSFGVNNEWSFDEDVNERLGCEVHSFDPSMGEPDHIHKNNMYFHNLGIWGSNVKDVRGWEMKDLKTIVHMLNHTTKTIDYIKVDVEGGEWSIIEHIIQSGVHSQIKQIGFEIHTPRRRQQKISMSVNDYGEIYNGFRGLSRLGFEIYLNIYHQGRCCGGFEVLTPARIAQRKQDLCCYEVFLTNRHFI